MSYRARISIVTLLTCLLASCSWNSYVKNYNYARSYNSNLKNLMVFKKDTVLPERIDSITIFDRDTLNRPYKRPTKYYTLIWYDSKDRKSRSGLFYKEYMTKYDTTFYKNGVIRSIQVGELCYTCRNWSYHSTITDYYDRKGRPLQRTTEQTDSTYKQYYNKKGNLLDERYTWPIYKMLVQ